MKLKWEALLAMVALIGLGFWLIYQPSSSLYGGTFRDDATLVPYLMGGQRGWIERVDSEGGATFRFVPRRGEPSAVLDEATLRTVLGDVHFEAVTQLETNSLFRVLNITSWSSLAWVLLGFGAQAVFAGRFLVQWLVSERERKSTVPDVFWWMSLIGGVLLFIYFVWRQDPVGVFGQSSGIVIYARNLRLIGKHKRRQAAEPAATEPGTLPTAAAEEPEDARPA